MIVTALFTTWLYLIALIHDIEPNPDPGQPTFLTTQCTPVLISDSLQAASRPNPEPRQPVLTLPGPAVKPVKHCDRMPPPCPEYSLTPVETFHQLEDLPPQVINIHPIPRHPVPGEHRAHFKHPLSAVTATPLQVWRDCLNGCSSLTEAVNFNRFWILAGLEKQDDLGTERDNKEWVATNGSPTSSVPPTISNLPMTGQPALAGTTPTLLKLKLRIRTLRQTTPTRSPGLVPLVSLQGLMTADTLSTSPPPFLLEKGGCDHRSAGDCFL